MVRNILEDGLDGDHIPLPKIRAPVLAKILEYWKMEADTDAENLADAKETFLTGLKYSELLECMIAANFMDAQSLLTATVSFFAKRIANKTPDEIRLELGITTPFLPGEIEQAMENNKWVFLKKSEGSYDVCK